MEIIEDLLGVKYNPKKIHKPSDLYKILHPELFSDSRVEKEKIDKEQFKYILSTLSTDMRQDAFENLTRCCIIKLITPNIIPQTGPTGGGDAKADFITYPVSDKVSALWSVAEGNKNNEIWAFAVSTKKEWSQKMDSDVKKIIEHIPNCTRIFFCTNQKVSSRNRDQKQQKYKKKEWGGIDTFILDQNWYLQAIYDQGCYNDAIESLGLRDSLKEVTIPGPLDLEREKKLKEIEAKLPKNLSDGINDKYVADLLSIALLSRGLNKSEQEVNGRFLVALSAAKKYGLPQQVYECIYQKACTDFYWYDNPDSTLEGYLELKKMLAEDVSVIKIEKAINLFRLLATTGGTQELLHTPFDYERERHFFDNLFNEISHNPCKPSCSLFLKINLLEDRLIQELTNNNEKQIAHKNTIDSIVEELSNSFNEAANHMEIDFDSQVDMMIILGRLIGTNPKFDNLIDTISEIQSIREKDISAANIQFERGLQHINNNNFEDAVRHLNRSYVLYHKKKTIGKLIKTSGLLGKAYSELDLLYSAKTCYSKAIGLLFNTMGSEGRSDHLIVSLLRELCFIEIRLGQITTFLEWLSLLDNIVALIPGYLDEDFLKYRGMMDVLLGARIYNTSLDNPEYSILPDILSRHQLDFSCNVLLIKMGRNDDVSNDYRFLLDSEDSTKRYILQLSEKENFLFPLTINANKKARLQTLAHGCTFVITYSGVSYGQTYSEMFLSFMEMLMNSKTMRVFPSTPMIVFEMNCSTEGETKIEKGHDSHHYRVIINKKTFDIQDNVWNTLIEMMSNVISGSIMVDDIERFLKERQQDEYFMQRISLLSGYIKDVFNFCPYNRKAYIELFSRSEDRKYAFKMIHGNENQSRSSKQSDSIITSLIDIKLWDEAKWKGCGYLLTRDLSEPGIMVFLYENIVSGIKIFEKWADNYNEGKLNIKIVIITGIDKRHPYWYKVLITPDIKQILYQEIRRKERYIISSSRFHLMNAVSDENIKLLEDSYKKFSFIGLSASAIVNNKMSFDKEKRYNKIIPVRNVEFVEAWTIKENDVESVAILADDDVIIPAGREADAPVLAIIEKKKQNV